MSFLRQILWKNALKGKVLETNVVIAKKYLSEEEIKELNNLKFNYSKN